MSTVTVGTWVPNRNAGCSDCDVLARDIAQNAMNGTWYGRRHCAICHSNQHRSCYECGACMTGAKGDRLRCSKRLPTACLPVEEEAMTGGGWDRDGSAPHPHLDGTGPRKKLAVAP